MLLYIAPVKVSSDENRTAVLDCFVSCPCKDKRRTKLALLVRFVIEMGVKDREARRGTWCGISDVETCYIAGAEPRNAREFRRFKRRLSVHRQVRLGGKSKGKSDQREPERVPRNEIQG